MATKVVLFSDDFSLIVVNIIVVIEAIIRGSGGVVGWLADRRISSNIAVFAGDAILGRQELGVVTRPRYIRLFTQKN